MLPLDKLPPPPASQWLPAPLSRTASTIGLPPRSPPRHQPPVLRLEATDVLSPSGAVQTLSVALRLRVVPNLRLLTDLKCRTTVSYRVLSERCTCGVFDDVPSQQPVLCCPC